MEYLKAVRDIPVEIIGEDGQVVRDEKGRPLKRLAKRGDDVPEAENWPYRDTWIMNGHLCYQDEELPKLGPQGNGPKRALRVARVPSPSPALRKPKPDDEEKPKKSKAKKE